MEAIQMIKYERLTEETKQNKRRTSLTQFIDSIGEVQRKGSN